ncbi:ABC transporter ATP-binding protein [Candidimonas nitroreducens]|uniref:ABC transporter ATP-binding protein n=1 Tax=Candidimonas nitroreducens TaxID=683354 RepID=A0A225MG91_9BURK|nr:ABC transporter ATP-binding protein [Candidimonas nitroreducens]OWT60376.1 ABC transporter ATP-binding protein [Candidimonas nitroreducens]
MAIQTTPTTSETAAASQDAGPSGTARGGEVLLEVRDVVKAFGGLHAVDHCSFDVRRGTITGLIGPNGAGKTTMFNNITGFITPDSGTIRYRGQDITGLRPDQIFASGLCRTFQIPREHGTMSVLENLMLVPMRQKGENIWNAWFHGAEVRRQEEQNRDKALEVLGYLELTHVRDEYAGNLSGGQKKLLELGRTLMTGPELVLLDEPAAGVNRTLLKRLTSNIEYLSRERGITFLLIEHDMNMVMSLCDPVIVMSEGRKLVEGSPDEVRNNQSVLEAYLGGQYAAAEG